MRKRFGLNTASYGYGQLVTVLVQFVQIPFFLKYWGTAHYAEWLVLTGLPQLLSLLDIGVSQAFASKATMSMARKDSSAAISSLQTSLCFTLTIAASALVIGLAAAYSVDWTDLLRLNITTSADAAAVVALMTCYLCLNLFSGPLGAWFRVIDRTALGAFFLANRRVLDVVVSISILVTGGDLIDLACALVITQLVALILVTAVAKRISPWPVFGLRHARWSELRSIWKPAGASAAIPIAQAITLQGGLQLLNQLATPATVVAFSMARTFMRLIIQGGITANNALVPEISRLAGSGRMAEAKRFTLKTSIIVAALGSLAYAAMIGLGSSVVGIWSGGKVSVGPLMLASIGAHALLNIAWYVPAALLIATNRHVALGATYAFASIVAIGAWVLAPNLIAPIFASALLLVFPEVAVLILVAVRFSIRAKSPK